MEWDTRRETGVVVVTKKKYVTARITKKYKFFCCRVYATAQMEWDTRRETGVVVVTKKTTLPQE